MVLERTLLARAEACLRPDEAEPTPVGGSCRTRVVALVEGVEGSRACAVKLHELLVVALEGLLAEPQDPRLRGAQHEDGVELG
jgi:hypothetical protein